MATTKSPRAGYTSDLLALPAEIRVKILYYALVTAYPVRCRHHITWFKEIPVVAGGARSNARWQEWSNSGSKSSSNNVVNVNRPCGQVLRTCQQIYDEGIEMLYRDNVFAITLMIGDELWVDQRFDFLGCRTVDAAFAKFPRLARHATNFAVVVNIDPYINGDLGSPTYVRSVEQTVQQIRDRCPARMGFFGLYLEQNGGFQQHSCWTDGVMVLSHDIGLLRANRTSFTGLTEHHRARLQRVVESQTPVRRLKDEYYAVASYSRIRCGWQSRRAQQAYGSCMSLAAINWDEQIFQRLREEIHVLAAVPSLNDFRLLLDQLGLLRDWMSPALYVDFFWQSGPPGFAGDPPSSMTAGGGEGGEGAGGGAIVDTGVSTVNESFSTDIRNFNLVN